jgi:hypothetical protein
VGASCGLFVSLPSHSSTTKPKLARRLSSSTICWAARLFAFSARVRDIGSYPG